ncbi:hypothetical protein BH11MYX1_BH11MYX1_50300 [soil metagenome]
MTKLLILASLLSSACLDTQQPAAASTTPVTTTAAPTPPPSPPPVSGSTASATPGCQAQGAVLFQSETKPSQPGAPLDVPLRTTILYEAGGFTYTEMTKGKRTAAVTGCLSNDRLAKVRDDLQRATWQTSAPTGMRCMAMAITFEEYSSHGKVLWDAVVCGDKTLDA